MFMLKAAVFYSCPSFATRGELFSICNASNFRMIYKIIFDSLFLNQKCQPKTTLSPTRTLLPLVCNEG